MVRIPAEKNSKHNPENSNKHKIMYEISNIYHKKNEVLPAENIFFLYSFFNYNFR